MDGLVSTARPFPSATPAERLPSLRLAGFSGLAMLVAIIVNGPLAAARGVPQYWDPNASTAIAARLGDAAAFPASIAFFFLSTLIFVFGIPFISGLRRVVREQSPDGLGADIVLLGGGLFFGAGLLSEVLSTGFSIVVQSAPSYVLDANGALAVQALQFAALVQGQVGLGLVLIATSVALSRRARAPMWLVALGLLAGVLDLLRPLAAANPPLAIGLFLPTFVWIAAVSTWLVRTRTSVER